MSHRKTKELHTDAPLRIAMLGHKHMPSREGGVEVVVGELAVRMAARGHSVTCYNRSRRLFGRGSGTGGQKSYHGVKRFGVPTINRPGIAAATSSVFGTILCAFGPYDVVHFHAEGPAFLCWLPKLFGKKVIVTVHGLDHLRAKWGRFASAYIMSGERAAVRHADHIIVLSGSARTYFDRTYGRDTILIPNGVRQAKRMPARVIHERYGLRQDDYILFLARLVPEKGLAYLLRAFREVKTDKRLVIVGAADDSAYLNRMKALAAGDDRVLFTGFLSGRPLQELYSNAYLYCLPSDLEGMPLSLLEAMSYGNCCLTSDISECTEVAGACAATFRKSDEEDLRAQLQRLIDTPSEVEAYRREAAERVCARFSWDDVTERTLALYRTR